MYSNKCKVIFSIPLILNILALALYSLQSGVQAPEIIFGIDKVYHFLAFFILGIFARIFSEVNYHRYNNIIRLALSIIIVSIYGVIDEGIQYFVPGRDSSQYDLLADFAGVAVSSLFWKRLIIIFNNIFKKKCLN